jgi:type I restriction enzyme, S subunit
VDKRQRIHQTKVFPGIYAYTFMRGGAMSEPRNSSNSGATVANPEVAMDVQEANAQYLPAAERQLPKGYKQTEAGVIPDDWDIHLLASLTSEIGDGIHSTPVYSSNGDYYFINGNNIINGRIVITAETKTVDINEYVRHGKRLDVGSILLSINGTIGNVGLFSGEQIVLGKSAAYLNLSPNVVRMYIYHAIQNDFVKRQFSDGLTGSTIKNLGLGTIRNTLIPIPPTKAEQEAIAEALSDADALIEALEQLVAKKRQLKQGAMQELLTGKRRLPGFSGEWTVIELKHLVSTPITDGPHLTPMFYDAGVPFLSVNNLVNNKIDLTDLRYISKRDDENFSKKCKPKNGDILLGKAASVGKVAIVEEEFDFNIWSPIALIRPNGQINAKFLYYQLLSVDCIAQIMLLTNSSSQGNIGMGDIEKIQISFPDHAEQTAIAQILTDMDAEITELETKLTKARAVKQGMMQQLLTGRIRLL